MNITRGCDRRRRPAELTQQSPSDLLQSPWICTSQERGHLTSMLFAQQSPLAANIRYRGRQSLLRLFVDSIGIKVEGGRYTYKHRGTVLRIPVVKTVEQTYVTEGALNQRRHVRQSRLPNHYF